MDTYKKKLENFMLNELALIDKPIILEFGVRKGTSTKEFIKICEKKNGFLYSIDIDDYSNILKSDKWKFFQCRDDHFEFLENKIPQKFDLIYMDSFHQANHVEKILYHYYPKLKVSGKFVIDDISWIPYLSDNYRNNFGCEISNQETFERLLEISRANQENFDLDFTFVSSGLAKIKKLNENKLSVKQKIKSRKNSLKNRIRKIIYSFKNK